MNNKEIEGFEFPRARLALFTKAPVKGKVKTRLQGVLGVEGALNLHKLLIEKSLKSHSESRLCPVQLWVAMDSDCDNLDDEYLVSICNKNNICEQSGSDLGARMAHAARQLLESADSVLIVGTDCVSVDADYLRQALTLLASGESIVIGPAEDGGYVLLGLREVPDCLFDKVPWGTAEVMAATRQNLAAAGLSWRELPPRWDVDVPEDLPRLRAYAPDLDF